MGCAMVVSNNFYGATALAILFSLLVVSIWITHHDLWMFARAAGIAILLPQSWLGAVSRSLKATCLQRLPPQLCSGGASRKHLAGGNNYESICV